MQDLALINLQLRVILLTKPIEILAQIQVDDIDIGMQRQHFSMTYPETHDFPLGLPANYPRDNTVFHSDNSDCVIEDHTIAPDFELSSHDECDLPAVHHNVTAQLHIPDIIAPNPNFGNSNYPGQSLASYPHLNGNSSAAMNNMNVQGSPHQALPHHSDPQQNQVQHQVGQQYQDTGPAAFPNQHEYFNPMQLHHPHHPHHPLNQTPAGYPQVGDAVEGQQTTTQPTVAHFTPHDGPATTIVPHSSAAPARNAGWQFNGSNGVGPFRHRFRRDRNADALNFPLRR